MPYDFMPAVAEHGGHNILRRGVMNAGETFSVGDLVFVNADGEVAQFPTNATPAVVADISGTALIAGVAANPGVDPSTNTNLIDPRTGAAYATGAEILFWPADQQTIFKTRNCVTAANTPTAPSGTLVGESRQILFDNTAGRLFWCIDTDTAGTIGTDICARVIAVLDSRGRRISATDTTTGDSDCVSVNSLTATNTSPFLLTPARRTFRPIRPNPLIPTLTAIRIPYLKNMNYITFFYL